MSHVTFHLRNLQKNIDASTAALQSSNIIERLWEKDHTVWRSEEEHQKSILNRLGWLESVALMHDNIGELEAFARSVCSAGFTHAVVLGMGGSSLCPDVCRATFGSSWGFPQLHVLDSTNPASVLRVEREIALATTLFIVASKSGGTTETNMFYKYFYDRVGKVKGGNAGDNFVAITDANTSMEKIAVEKKFRKIFLNPADIGGRYSALSYFGLVPMALIGMDIRRLLENAMTTRRSCSHATIRDNPSAMLGIAMGEAFKAGRDKLTWIASPEVSTFAFWTEQLIAESTGKEGKGIVPIEGEGSQVHISRDRFYVLLSLGTNNAGIRSIAGNLESSGAPYVEVNLSDTYELGGEFFRWEFATSVAAAVMHINPFDEPNVKESKDNTVRVIEEFKQTGGLPRPAPVAQGNGLTLYCEPEYAKTLDTSGGGSVKDLLLAHLHQCKEGDYAGLLAYIDQNSVHTTALLEIRERIRQISTCATTLGFGPRYLHSTGQLHKGGKHNGVFILITAEENVDVAIPGEPFSFEILKNAQALGDYRSLAGRGLRLVRVHLGKNIESGLEQLRSLIN